MTDTPTLVGELVYLTGITEAARHHMKNGQMLDLSSLDERCATLWTRLETVTGPEREMLHAAFRALVSELKRLEAELKPSRDATMTQIGPTTRRGRAASANGNAARHPSPLPRWAFWHASVRSKPAA